MNPWLEDLTQISDIPDSVVPVRINISLVEIPSGKPPFKIPWHQLYVRRAALRRSFQAGQQMRQRRTDYYHTKLQGPSRLKALGGFLFNQ